MKKIACFVLTLMMVFSFISVIVSAADYTEFNIVFEETEGKKVNETEIKIFASVDDGALVDRTNEFTTEDVEWFKYISEPEEGKTADDYDYVDEELKIYGILCTDEDIFDHDNYSYFLRIARLYAKEEDTFYRNVKINGVDIEEMNGICFNTGSEFFIKTVTNGGGGPSGEEDVTDESALPEEASESSSEAEEKDAKSKCSLCGICPIQPLGICLFIWIAVILIVVIIVIVIISKNKKNNKKQK